MKKLIVICMLGAIGAVGMIEKSSAAPSDCGAVGLCGPFGKNGPDRGPMPGGNRPNIPHVDQHQQGNFTAGNQPWKHNNPNWQASNNNGQWWLNHQHRHHNWNGGAPFIGLGIYNGGPGYYDDPYYDDSYGYGADPYAYSYPPRSYSSMAGRCDAWAQRLRSVGYRNVRATDCVGTSFVYRATKAGKAVKVTVRAGSGSIIRVASAY